MKKIKDDFYNTLKDSSILSLTMFSQFLKSDFFKEREEKRGKKIMDDLKEDLRRLHENPKFRDFFDETDNDFEN